MSNAAQPYDFQTTHWSLVVASQHHDSETRRQSLSELCRMYWFPLFVYLRRKEHSPDDAADYVQGFFLELMVKEYLESASPEKGRFRWFLMSAIRRYVGKQRRREGAVKRGGGQTLMAIDWQDAESRYQLEPVDGWTAEKLFERRWALTVLQQALKELEQQQKAKEKHELYLALQPTLSGTPFSQSQYEEIAVRLGMSPGAVKVAGTRLRQSYRRTLEQIVRQTVDQTEAIDAELEFLLAALRG